MALFFLNESTIQASDALMSAIKQIHNKTPNYFTVP